jgi:hypothetical protein
MGVAPLPAERHGCDAHVADRNTSTQSGGPGLGQRGQGQLKQGAWGNSDIGAGLMSPDAEPGRLHTG